MNLNFIPNLKYFKKILAIEHKQNLENTKINFEYTKIKYNFKNFC